MSAKNVLGVIFSNAYDEAIPEMTSFRAMGSIPFAGRYRLIDFPLSNMVNAGITKVGVITNSNYHSLMDHIGNGKAWDLSRKNEGLTILPPFNQPTTGNYAGKVDALLGSIGFISDSSKDYVLITDCNIISSIDYEAMLKFTVKANADAVIAYAEGQCPKLNKETEFVLESNGKIKEILIADPETKGANYSMNTIIVKRTLLERLLHEGKNKRISDLEELFANNVNNVNLFGYKVDGYIKVIGSINDYYEANLELLDPSVRKEIFAGERPVYTKTGDRIPAYYGISAKVVNSLIADGCKIEGEVENSILFRGATVAKGAVVKNSIIMQDAIISDGSSIECVICDKGVVVKSGKKLCGADNYPVYVGKGIII